MSETTPLSKIDLLQDFSEIELGQALAERLTISDKDWHRLKGNRQAQAKQQIASALIFLLRERPQQALTHLNQAVGWLDGSLSSPPCPDRDRFKNNRK